MKLLITGDFVVNQTYNPSQINKELIELFGQSDYNIVNLEAPVTKSTSKILKTGPHLKSDRGSTEKVLKVLNINMCTLANNHILDYGEQGVLDTLNFCHKNGIETVGAGRNKEESSKIYFLDTSEYRIGIINIAENEWASATTTTAGANGMDIIDDVKSIQNAKQHCDFLLVIVHGGHEYYNLPSPRMQKQYRFYIDNGADLVVGHHPHCISGMETYKEREIYYSLGNFLFTKPSPYKDWYKGMVLQVEITSEKRIVTNPIFINQAQKSYDLSMVDNNSNPIPLKRFSELTNTISQDLHSAWNTYITVKENHYKLHWSANVFFRNKYVRAMLNKLGIYLSSKQGLAILLNLMRCESHADLSKETLYKYLKP